MITSNRVACKQQNHCLSTGYRRTCVLSSLAFLGSCWHMNIYMFKQQNLQWLRLAYDADKALPWPFHSGMLIINNVPVSLSPPRSATQAVFRTSLRCLSCSVSTVLMTLLSVLCHKPYILSPYVYIRGLCVDFHDEFCSQTLSPHGF